MVNVDVQSYLELEWGYSAHLGQMWDSTLS